MKTITKISTQKKSSNRYNVFLDNEYAFSVDEDVLIKHQLHKGLTLSEDEIANIADSDTLQRSYLLAIHYVSFRMRSIQEVLTYLRGKDVEELIIHQIIDRLLKENILNDANLPMHL